MRALSPSLKNIFEIVDTRRSIGAAWFILLGVFSCLAVFCAYRVGGPLWRELWGRHGQLHEVTTSFLVVFFVYYYRYFVFPASDKTKTRNHRVAVKLFGLSLLIFAAWSSFNLAYLAKVSPPGGVLLYSMYVFMMVCVVGTYGCEVPCSVFSYHSKRTSRLADMLESRRLPEFLKDCISLRNEIDVDSRKLMWGIICAAISILFISWTQYGWLARALHMVIFVALVVTCIYPFMKIRALIITERINKEIDWLDEKIGELDIQILEKQKENVPYREAEERRDGLWRSKEGLLKKLESERRLTFLEKYVGIVSALFTIVGNLIAWTGR